MLKIQFFWNNQEQKPILPQIRLKSYTNKNEKLLSIELHLINVAKIKKVKFYILQNLFTFL